MPFTVTEKQIDQRNKDIAAITETLKTLGHATSFDIADLTGINRNRVKDLMKAYVMVQNPGCVKAVHSKGYFWEGPVEEPKKEPKPERYPDTHNHEGYPDPTMARAMRNVVNSEYTPGEVWVYKDYNGEERLYLILGSIKGSVTGLKVNDVDGWYDEKEDVSISVKGKPYYVEPCRILSKPSRILDRSRDTVSDLDMAAIRKKIAEFLGVQTKERVVEVEKVVEKEVKVPVEVEVVKEIPVPDESSRAEVTAEVERKFRNEIAVLEENLYNAEHDVEMALKEADIWKKAFYAVTCGY